MNIKTERLKKLESELRDLDQWLKLSLVPKKDMDKHKSEIVVIESKIEEEKERIQFLKDSGNTEELYATRKTNNRSTYTENPSMSEIDIGTHNPSITEGAVDVETDAIDVENSILEEHEDEVTEVEETEEEDPFSDKARWKRGLLDPDDDQW